MDEYSASFGSRSKTPPPAQKQLTLALAGIRHTFVVSDARKRGMPIVYASAGFFSMTGYKPAEVMGRNCNFLQGPDTNKKEVEKLRVAIAEGKRVSVKLVNYRKDGSPFWNFLTIAPVRLKDGTIAKYIGIQVDVTAKMNTAIDQAFADGHGLPLLVKYDVKRHHTPDQNGSSSPSKTTKVYNPPPPLPTNRSGLDIASTIKRIQKNFVVSDPALPDCPIVFVSDDFCRLSQYPREEILGRNCRFMQGPATDPRAVKEIREAVKSNSECTVRLINYKKNKQPFWNMLTLAPVLDENGKAKLYVGVQTDVSEEMKLEVEESQGGLSQQMSRESMGEGAVAAPSTKGDKDAALHIGRAASKDLPRAHNPWSTFDGQLPPTDKPHQILDYNMEMLRKVYHMSNDRITADNFTALKTLGAGDVGTVQLVQLRGTKLTFAMKILTKEEMLARNKVQRVKTEEVILNEIDHPFLPRMYAAFQTEKYLHFVMEHYPGGQLYSLLMKQPGRCFQEHAARFYAAEVLLAIQYLHLLGFIYRDLKPENILLQANGHIVLTDFDLSYLSTTNPQIVRPSNGKVIKASKESSEGTSGASCMSGPPREEIQPLLVAEPEDLTNSFVGTEEYLAPEVVSANGHNCIADWWSFGIFIHELLYGVTPFKGIERDNTLENVLNKTPVFAATPIVSNEAKNIISALLEKYPPDRLGSVCGADDIKGHPFFADVRWSLIRNEKAPFIPEDKSEKIKALLEIEPDTMFDMELDGE
mmetsp:Transcript_18169/g.21767  ORF Transcript_18169/g.21767 Transcript_18169/m.21767 type:complete len:755 (+) Transcript_18169:451-2715(+)|eukprot:CAMPEP_0197864872 /NCGR_PEP_ID=MMETSP1438-20131217/43337_1 /TAXON_ID=1461541 /ORGANISM="Pterosperma sp., Strain CCMP1384" /LENGTH=754 /DNA_ID=CAMNT_0043483247 /DNA_START=440 /DNA_END=2704 /DNA_ORIENTATION=-